ncbi:hypothetical protein V6N13_040074 [Hibiscus sabdariffa]
MIVTLEDAGNGPNDLDASDGLTLEEAGNGPNDLDASDGDANSGPNGFDASVGSISLDAKACDVDNGPFNASVGENNYEIDEDSSGSDCDALGEEGSGATDDLREDSEGGSSTEYLESSDAGSYETDSEERPTVDERPKFRRLYVCFSALKEAFKRDSNNQIFPIAWAVVEVVLVMLFWSKAFFSTRSKCDAIDNNFSEAFNVVILGARFKSVMSLFEDIRHYAMHRLVENKRKSHNWKGAGSALVENVISQPYTGVSSTQPTTISQHVAYAALPSASSRPIRIDCEPP